MKSDKLHRIPGGFSLPSWLLRDVDATQVCSLSIETLIIGWNQKLPLMGVVWFLLNVGV